MHHHGDPRHHHSKSAHSRLGWIFGVSALYMVAEFVGGLWTGSLALLADAGHMAIDVAAIALSLFALWVAKRPANESKTFGYVRAEVLAALVNGATLAAMAIWICIEAYARYRNPPPIDAGPMIIIATGGLILNLVSLALLHRDKDAGINARGVWWHLVGDTLGSLSAIAAGGLAAAFGWNGADPILSVVISVLILGGAWRLLGDCVNVLLEGTPKGLKPEAIREKMEQVRGVVEVHDLHVWTVTSGLNALSAHVKIDQDGSQARILQELTESLARVFQIEHITLQLEPPSYTHAEVDCAQRGP